jgi:hypothetical protein
MRIAVLGQKVLGRGSVRSEMHQLSIVACAVEDADGSDRRALDDGKTQTGA